MSGKIVLSDPNTQNPLTIAASGYVSDPTNGIIATDGSGWTIANHGTVVATNYNFTAGGASYGVMVSGTNSELINGAPGQSGGVIGGNYGVFALAGATVVNYGLISGFGMESTFRAGCGVKLLPGGILINAAGGIVGGHIGAYAVDATIVNAGTIVGAADGVALFNGSTLTNAGTISASGGDAVYLVQGSNRLIVDPGAVFNGLVVVSNYRGAQSSGVLELAGGLGTGTIGGIGTQFQGFQNIVEDAGAVWTLTGGNTITSGVTVSIGAVAYLEVGGSLTNAGSISGTLLVRGGGVLLNQPGGEVSGTVFGSYGAASVTNLGALTGTSFGLGVDLTTGGVVTNGSLGAAPALISGYSGVQIAGGTGAVINAGTIAATGGFGDGVVLDAGGSRGQSGGSADRRPDRRARQHGGRGHPDQRGHDRGHRRQRGQPGRRRRQGGDRSGRSVRG